MEPVEDNGEQNKTSAIAVAATIHKAQVAAAAAAAAADGSKSESTASITSAIMLKIPAENMSGLREDFLAARAGLRLPAFLVAVLSAMGLGAGDTESESGAETRELLLMVADLVDFFELVDINGDGFMEWEEFVMFILDAVVKEPEALKDERFYCAETRAVQAAAGRECVLSAVAVPALGKCLMGVGAGVHIYAPDDKAKPSSTLLVHQFPLTGAVGGGGGARLNVLHMQYLEGHDVLAVLRSDMQVEFFKFLSRSNHSSETIESLGRVSLGKPCRRLLFRVSALRKPRLLVIGTSSVIDSFLFTPMGSNGLASLSDPQTLDKHTDYVRDIITIDSGPSRFIVSASLDKSVMFWDLDSGDFRFKRTGHSAGVESLAFGGKSLLFAGGFDYSILVWDVTAAINKPLFALRGGHLSCVVRVVGLEGVDRCASLDEAGVLCWWDTSRSILGEDRLLHSATCPEDHATCFAVLADLPHYFEALHGVIFLAAGRRQHVFKLRDVSSHEGPPLCVLYSAPLQSIFTVHSREVLFWSSVSGEQYRVAKDLVGLHVKITCAALDDRGRRLLLGDSSGAVRVYNCLSGQLMRTLEPLGVAVKQLVCSPDKNLLVVTEHSDIFIVDDCGEDAPPTLLQQLPGGADYALRSVHFSGGGPLADIVSLAYSPALGLFASLDARGRLVLWDYLFATPELMIEQASGRGEEGGGQLQFIGDLPLLLLADTHRCFSVLTLATQSGSNKRKQLWRLQTVLPARRGDEQQQEGGMRNVGPRALPYTATACAQYLQQGAEVRSMAVHVQQGVQDQHQEQEQEQGPQREKHHRRARPAPSSPDSFSPAPSGSPQSSFPRDWRVRVMCGFDDGTVSVTDLTAALRVVDVGPLLPADHVSLRLNYNPKGRCVRHMGASDCRTLLTPAQTGELLRVGQCQLQSVKDCHRGAVTSLRVVGGFQRLLSASEDQCVLLWDLTGEFLGLLSRGSAMDKLFRKSWSNPEDLVSRNSLRVNNAAVLVQQLGLVAQLQERAQVARRGEEGGSAQQQQLRQLEGGGGEQGGVRARARRGGKEGALVDPRDLAEALRGEVLGGTGGGAVTADSISRALKVVERFPGRSRLLCQLEEQITYEPSKKDVARLQLMHASVSAAQAQAQAQASTSAAVGGMAGTGKSGGGKGRRKKRRVSGAQGGDGGSGADQKYLRTIQLADQCLASTQQRQRGGGGGPLSSTSSSSSLLSSGGRGGGPVRAGGAREGKHGAEVAAIDAADPGNWEISSVNRLREMYHNLHVELGKGGQLALDQDEALLMRLRALCPGGDVPGYFEVLRRDYRRRRRKEVAKEEADSRGGGRSVCGVGEYRVFEVQGEGEGGGGLVEVARGEDDGGEQGGGAGRGKAGLLLDQDHSEEEDCEEESGGEESGGEEEEHDGRGEHAMTRDELVKEQQQTYPSPSPQKPVATTITIITTATAAPAPPAPAGSAANGSTGARARAPSMGKATPTSSARNLLMSPKCSPPSTPCCSPLPRQCKSPSQTKSPKSPKSPSQLGTSKSKSTAALLDPPDFLARQRTSSLLQAFEQRLEGVELAGRRAARKTRLQGRAARKTISSSTALLLPAARLQADPLASAERLSLDFMQEGGELKLQQGRWGHKARALMLEMGPRQRVVQETTRPPPALHQIRRMLTRTSSLIAETYLDQLRREELLLSRRSFGPYVTSELLQVVELFKSFPKQIPGPEDTVLLAGTSPEVELGTGLTTNPVLGCISLLDLVKHRWMRNRPHFKSFLDKVVLMRRPDMNAGLFISLDRVFVHICPLLATKDRRDLAEFCRVYRGPETQRELQFAPQHRQQLKRIFDLFDSNGSGSIDCQEIRAVLDSATLARLSSPAALVGHEEGVLEGEVDDKSLGSILSEAGALSARGGSKGSASASASVSLCSQSSQNRGMQPLPEERQQQQQEQQEQQTGEIDFPAFLALFGKLLFPPLPQPGEAAGSVQT